MGVMGDNGQIFTSRVAYSFLSCNNYAFWAQSSIHYGAYIPEIWKKSEEKKIK